MSNLRLEFNMTSRGSTMHRYTVSRLEGEWPQNKNDLITMCDNRSTTDLTVRHFGGNVHLSGKVAYVEVYVD